MASSADRRGQGSTSSAAAGSASDLDYLDDYEGHPQREEPGLVDWYGPAVLMIVAVVFLIPSVQLGLGDLADPGPGLWPFINCVLVLILCPVALLTRHRFTPPDRAGVLRVLGVVIPLLLFVPLYDWAGLIGAGAPALLVIARWVGGMKWIPALAVSILTPVIVYVLFAMLLGVNLRPF